MFNISELEILTISHKYNLNITRSKMKLVQKLKKVQYIYLVSGSKVA